MDIQNFKKRIADINSDLDNSIEEAHKGYVEANRVHDIAANTSQILDDLDEEFCKKTHLTKTDMIFLFTAIGLQIVRQYLITKFPQPLDDQTAAKNTPGHMEEHSNRHHKYYNPSLNEIICNPVPFDANIGANGALKGGGKMGHRVTAIGHDPLLGLIWGTANIATSTLTTSSFQSYHIYTNNLNRDYFKSNAKTYLVLKYTTDKMLHQGNYGKEIIAVSLMKEIIHLRSDINTTRSLPLPVISAINPKLASTLAEYGFNMANAVTVGKQASYAICINSIIAMIHRMFCLDDNVMESKLYEVRTRKILMYSNLVASSSNLAITAITKNMKLLDLGGLAVTIYRLITDTKFIKEVKEEFVFGSYSNMIMGDYLC